MSVAAPLMALFQDEASHHVATLDRSLAALRLDPNDWAARTKGKSAAAALTAVSSLVEADALGELSRSLELRLGAEALDSASLEALSAAADLLRTGIACAGEPKAATTVKAAVPLLDRLAAADADQGLAAGRAAPAPVQTHTTERPSLYSADPSLLVFFAQDLERSVHELSLQLVELETGRSSAAVLERLMRAAHSLKGAARVTGIEAIVALAHAMEDCFVAAQHAALTLEAEQIDVLLTATDQLAALARVPAGALPAQLAAHEAELRQQARLVATITRGSPAQSTQPPASSSSALLDAADAPLVATRAQLPSKAPDNEAQTDDRVVRVTAASMERFVGLSGEALVEARRSGGFVGTLARLKQRQAHMADLLEGTRTADGNALGEVRQALTDCRTATGELLGELESYARTLEDLAGRLYNEAIKSRMRPLADGTHGLSRLARDTARRLGKQVHFEVLGERTGVDRDVLEALAHPLQHLVRNAIDHGLESPEGRALAGKPPEGRLRLEARHHAGTLAITVSDDGAGVSHERLREKLMQRKLADAAMIERLSPPELLEFLFLPGFSTAREVTDISGRGVGLDVVKSAVEALGGQVRITSSEGRGTSFHLKLPVTRSVIRAVIVVIGGEPYAFPLLRVERIIRLTYAEVRTLERRQYVDLDGQSVGLVRAHEILDTEENAGGDELLVVTVGDTTRSFGLVVDSFVGEHDLVVRPLDVRLGKVPNVSAAAILSDGSPVLILDVDDVLRSIDHLLSRGAPTPSAPEPTRRSKAKRVLVVDDSVTVRELQKQLLKSQGYQVDLAVDGMDGWLSLSKAQYDLVISDVDMPRMNGFQLVRQIKQDQRFRTIPVVIVSYKDRPEDRQKGLEAGANYYLTKSSFHDRTLLDAVADLIGEAT